MRAYEEAWDKFCRPRSNCPEGGPFPIPVEKARQKVLDSFNRYDQAQKIYEQAYNTYQQAWNKVHR